MDWYYEENGRQAGPVTDEQFGRLFQTGEINADTLVWRNGLSDWAPYRQAMAQSVRPPVIQTSVSGAGASGLAGPVCAECGGHFPADELVTLNKTLVCAQCKPLFIQRLSEGVPAGGAGGLWREGKRVVTRSETPFPDRCVKCNAPADGFRLRRVLYWQHPAYYLLLLVNLIVLLVVVLIVRKKAILHIGLCEGHRLQRRIAIIACTVGMLGGVAMLCVAAVRGNGWLALTGGVCFFGGGIWGAVKGRTIAATKIDKEYVWVSGVCREFREQLPER